MTYHVPKTLRNSNEIVKVIEAVNKEDRPPSGSLMPLTQFIKDCRDKYFIDYDGFGYLVIDGKKVTGSRTMLSDREIDIAGMYRIKLASISRLFGARAQIDWLNR